MISTFWQGSIRAAVSLTFDDARTSQIDNGLSLFSDYDAHATFYVSHEAMEKRLDGWRTAVSQGHEIGGHTMLHPCSGNFPFAKDTALEDYTLERMENELREADELIEKLLGVEPVSFAYPCGQTFIGRGRNTRSYVPIIAERYATGRGFRDESANDPALCDPARLHAYGMDGMSGDELIGLVEGAVETEGWIIFAGHEIGVPESRQTTGVKALRRLLEYIRDREDEIWLGTMREIIGYVNEEHMKRGT